MNHSHILYDSDPHFKIDPISRNIVNESSRKTKLIQHDHNSERFTFEVPRFVEGHDLSECNNVEIHYLNVEANTKAVRDGVYTVDDLHVKEDDEDTVVCSWLIPNNATQFVGQLQFLIRFACINDNTGITEYVWNTAVYSGIAVSSGIYNVDSASDNFVSPYTLVVTINGQVLKFFIGTKEEYNALSNDAKANLYAIITNENQLDGITETINQIINGEIVVPMATNASHAESATNASHAESATNASHAESATNASHAESATNASQLSVSPLYSHVTDGSGATMVKVNEAGLYAVLTLSDSLHRFCDFIVLRPRDLNKGKRVLGNYAVYEGQSGYFTPIDTNHYLGAVIKLGSVT